MGSRAVLAVYFLIAAVAAFVTAARTLSAPVLIAVVLALGATAMLLRRQVMGLGGTTRVSAAWLGVYLLTYAVFVLLLRR